MNRWVRARKGVLSWVILTTVITVVLVLQACSIRQNREQLEELEKLHDAACVNRANLQADIIRTENALRGSQGDLVFGIPRAIIEEGLEANRQEHEDLANLDC